PRIAAKVIDEFARLARPALEEEQPSDPLTERERAVLVRVARGMTNGQIARDLAMSVGMVKTHVQNIFQRFDLPNPTDTAVFAVQQGLLDEEDDGKSGV